VIRIGLDTNILAYLAGIDRGPLDKDRIEGSRALMHRLVGRADVVVAVQAAAELFVVLSRAGATRSEARDIVAAFTAGLERTGTTPEAFENALDLAAAHQLQMWDALILSSYGEAGCSLVLSEDMQHGQRFGALTVVNPFREPLHVALAGITPA
jgi:predicted nucleic acid-binding protein